MSALVRVIPERGANLPFQRVSSRVTYVVISPGQLSKSIRYLKTVM